MTQQLVINTTERQAALILDMDGVIVDSEPIHVDSFRVYLQRRNIVAEESFLLNLIGHSVEENMREINRKFFNGDNRRSVRDIQEREKIYIDLLRDTELSPKPGLDYCIRFCQCKGIRLALASSSIREQISAVLEILSIRDNALFDYRKVFSVVVSGEDVGRKKPAPDIYLLAIAKLGLSRERCIAVEDSPAGIAAAQAAGLKCLAARTEYVPTEKLAAADGIIDTLNDVPALMVKHDIIEHTE